MTIHFFDVDIAEEYGIPAAVLLQNLDYWTKQNEANETNCFDGRYWTFNSRRAYRELFPYMSERQINTAFQKLIDAGLVITGNYNKLAYDRTLWYALTEKGKSILSKCKMDYTELSNGMHQNVPPIPDNKPDNIPNNKPYKVIIEYLNEKARKAYKAASKSTQQHINARLAEGYTVEDFKRVIDNKCAEWMGNPKMEQYLRPSTLFGTKFEDYFNASPVNSKGANGVEITQTDDDELAGIL